MAQEKNKKAYLVWVCLGTRIVADEETTDEEIMDAAREKLHRKFDQEPYDHFEDFEEDEEIPYGEGIIGYQLVDPQTNDPLDDMSSFEVFPIEFLNNIIRNKGFSKDEYEMIPIKEGDIENPTIISYDRSGNLVETTESVKHKV